MFTLWPDNLDGQNDGRLGGSVRDITDEVHLLISRERTKERDEKMN